MGAGSRATSSLFAPLAARRRRRDAPKGLSAARGGGQRATAPSSTTSHNASGPQPVPAPRETRPAPSPNDCPSPIPYRALREEEGGEGGKDGTQGTSRSVVPRVSCSHILPGAGRPERQPGLRLHSRPFGLFLFKKKNPTLPLLTLHTHSHTHHGRHAYTRAPRGKPILAFPPRRQSGLGLLAERESRGRSRDL